MRLLVHTLVNCHIIQTKVLLRAYSSWVLQTMLETTIPIIYQTELKHGISTPFS